MLVVLAHAGFPWLPGGFVGVDMFFVLSGYLISGILITEFEQTGRIAFLQFYARRLKRLLPALLVVLCATAVLALLLLSELEAKAQLSAGGYAATWTSNLYFILHTIDYFDELSAHNLFLHTWSLAVEEQFYLLWPLLLLAVFHLAYHHNQNNRSIISLFILLLSISFVCSILLSYLAPQAAFFLMPSRIWQFALGSVICLTLHPPPNKSTDTIRITLKPSIYWLALIGGLLLVFGSAAILTPNITYPGGWALLPSFGAALLIVAGHGLDRGRGNPLSHPILIWVGDRSYSWYLWHWPILILGFSKGYQSQIVPTIILVFLSLTLAFFNYQYIELPFWKGRHSQLPLSRIFLGAFASMATVTVIFFFITTSPPIDEKLANLTKRWRSDVPIIYQMGCDTWYLNANAQGCVYGNPQGERTVVLLGDSVGAQWFSAIPEIFPAPQWRTVVFTKSSCPIVDEEIFYERIGKIYDVCSQWRNAVLVELERLKPNVIVVGGAATYEYKEQQWIKGSERIFKRLSRIAESVFVIPGTPLLGFDGPECLARHFSSSSNASLTGVCTAQDRLQQTDIVTQYLTQAANRLPNVRILELNDLVCPKGVCQACNTSGTVVFRDGRHLTDSFVRSITPAISQRINRITDELSKHNTQ